MRTLLFFACTLLLVVLVAFNVAVDAHKSVRHIKPQTEEARTIHQQMHLEQPPKEDGDHIFMRDALRDEYHPLDHSHKSNRHKKWGPEHPNHIKTRNWHYKSPRMVNGERIDDSVHDDDLHLFGLSKHDELH